MVLSNLSHSSPLLVHHDRESNTNAIKVVALCVIHWHILTCFQCSFITWKLSFALRRALQYFWICQHHISPVLPHRLSKLTLIHSNFVFFFSIWFKSRCCFLRESDKMDEDSSCGKKQVKLSSFGVTKSKRKSEETESSGKGHCKFFQARKLEQLTYF